MWIFAFTYDDSNATTIYFVADTREKAVNYMLSNYWDNCSEQDLDDFLVYEDCIEKVWSENGKQYQIAEATQI